MRDGLQLSVLLRQVFRFIFGDGDGIVSLV
jgi:hypothetical protein